MMPKTCEDVVTLLVVGSLLLDLHYGPYSRLWWQKNNNNSENEISNYFPIRIGQTTKIILNKRDFYTTILIGNSDNSFAPGFICTSGNFSSYVESTSSAAISNLYASIFQKKTRFSGPLVIGWNNKNIISQLSQNIPFFPFSFLIGKYQVFIYGIGSSLCEDWNNGGPGYKASLNYKYLDKPAIFVSTIENNDCILEIYQNCEVQTRFVASSPNEVWENSGIMKQYKGIHLFGLENSFTQKFIQQNLKPICSPENWHIFSLLKSVYDYNLKRRTVANIEWYQFFESWAKSKNPIIEFTSCLEKLYPSGYQFSERELNAWKAMLRATGCHNITPWLSNESEVSFSFIFYTVNY
jgi:hypothetical protein